ncbi:thioredoxin reductase [Trichophyton mentagrophytes]|nr:thioredoxin reductase [Trichophyton mentagrophytes]
MDESGLPADVLIVGGGPAGSNAAWELGKAHHRVTLFVGDKPVSSPSGEAGESSLPAVIKNRELFHLFQQETNKTQPVTVERKRITEVRRLPNGLFEAEDASGNVWPGRLLILADGAEEVMPDIAGYQTCWQQQRILTHPSEGKHGRVPVAVLAVGELAELTMALHAVWQIRQYASAVRVFTHGDPELAQELLSRVSPDAAITVESAYIQEIRPDADSSQGVTVQLDGGKSERAFLYHRRAAQLKGNDPFARQLRLELTESGAIRISARVPYMTSMDGVYAGGDCASLGQRTLFKALAMGEGVAAAVAARLERGRWKNLAYEEESCP